MPIEQYTYWSITLNNPDENDYLIMRNPNAKYIRELVWTREVGAEGTEHIQAWVRLQRNQSLAFVKKLYPRAHLKPTDKDVYNENSHQYAQKNDETTAGNHHITLNDPLPANDSLLYKVLDKGYDIMLEHDQQAQLWHSEGGVHNVIQRIRLTRLYTDVVEREMVVEKSGLEKIFISPVYEKMKQKYWKEILLRLKHNEDAIGSYVPDQEWETRTQTTEVGTQTEGTDETGSTCSGSSDDGSEDSG